MKSLKILAISISLSGFACTAFPQTAPKDKPAQSKAAPAASAPAENEVIPPVAPNALFPAVVAKVNGKSILGRDLERLVRQQLVSIGNPEWTKLREDYRGQLVLSGINSLVNSALIHDKAVASGMNATDAEVQEELKKISQNFQSDAEMNAALASQHTDRATLEKDLYRTVANSKYISENVTKKVVVTPEEVTKYYSSNPTEFQHSDVIRVSHILVQPTSATKEQDEIARQKAEALLARAQKGEDFAKLAKENSVDSSASQGGDIGFYSKQNASAEFIEAFSLPVGGLKLIRTNMGHHVIKVTEKKKEGLYTLDEVRDQLTEALKLQKAEIEMTKLVNQLRNEAKIEILVPAGQLLKP